MKQDKLLEQITKLIEKWGEDYNFSIKNEFEREAARILAENILALIFGYGGGEKHD